MLIRESNKCLESSIRKCRFLLKVSFINSPAVEENQKNHNQLCSKAYGLRLLDKMCYCLAREYCEGHADGMHWCFHLDKNPPKRPN